MVDAKTLIGTAGIGGNNLLSERRVLHNTSAADVKQNTSDAKFFGNGDMFQLLGKFSSKAQGTMKSTKAMQIDNVGCVIQSSTERVDTEGKISVAECMVFVPACHVKEEFADDGTTVIGRSIVAGY